MTDLVDKYSNLGAEDIDAGGSLSLVDKYSNLGAEEQPAVQNASLTTNNNPEPVINNEGGLVVTISREPSATVETLPEETAMQGITEADYDLSDEEFSKKVYSTYNPDGRELMLFPDSPDMVINDQINEAFRGRKKYQDENTSLLEKAGGVAETGLAIGSGATTGLLGRVGGTVKGLMDALQDKLKGKEWNPDTVQRAAEEMQSDLTYSPRGEKGQEYLKNTGEALKPLEAINPAQGMLLGQAARNASAIIPKGANAVKKAIPDEEVATTVKKAAAGNENAKMDVLDVAKLDDGAIKAAANLDIELPVDIFSQNELIKQLAGKARGMVAGDESVKFAEAIQTAVTKADDALESIGGTPDIAGISSKIKGSLDSSIAGLKKEAVDIYNKVDASVSKISEVVPSNLKSTLDDIVSEVGKDGLSKQEATLLRSIEGMTYGRLMREKSQIGAALGSKISQSPYSTVEMGSLKRLYGAIAKDQLGAVKSLGDESLSAQLRLANQLTAKRKGLEKRVVQTFGKDGEGSIAQKLKTAINQGAKGDVTNLNKVLKATPKELRKEAITTALSTLSQANRANQSGFNFSQYTKIYRGLRQNPTIYKKLVRELGQGSHQVLLDLHQVSKVVSDATSRVSKTGSSNQALFTKATGENIIVQIADKTFGVVDGVANRASLGIVGNNMIGTILRAGRTDKTKALAELFRDESFMQTMRGSAKTGINPQQLKKLSRSAKFKKWASSVGASNLQIETLLATAEQTRKTANINKEKSE